MTIFNQIESLPIAYVVVLMWVVCANVLGKLLGDALIEASSGSLKKVLSKPIHLNVTGDEITLHLFEEGLISNLNMQVLFALLGDFARCIGTGRPVSVTAEAICIQKNLYPEQYWSGCPPNAV